VHCWILKDKFQPNTFSDLNCTADLLLQTSQMFPNAINNGYDPTKIQSMMIPYSGTMLDENLPVNRNRFTVVHHTSWNIVPTSAVFDTIGGTPNVSVSGNLTRKFRFKIPTPSLLKWDRRDLDLAATSSACQTPCNVGDPFVVWGDCPYPAADGPDTTATSLVVQSYLTLRVEDAQSAAV
jgi:hypothetical protein